MPLDPGMAGRSPTSDRPAGQRSHRTVCAAAIRPVLAPSSCKLRGTPSTINRSFLSCLLRRAEHRTHEQCQRPRNRLIAEPFLDLTEEGPMLPQDHGAPRFRRFTTTDVARRRLDQASRPKRHRNKPNQKARACEVRDRCHSSLARRSAPRSASASFGSRHCVATTRSSASSSGRSAASNGVITR